MTIHKADSIVNIRYEEISNGLSQITSKTQRKRQKWVIEEFVPKQSTAKPTVKPK